jgi:hypothetical protein
VSDFPGSPSMLKGALVVFETVAPIPTNLIVFQYNPHTVTRGFQAAAATAGDAQRGSGDTRNLQPPVETFTLSVELHAADQLEEGNPIAVATGVHPTLAALELLLYPSITMRILNKALMQAGIAMVSPPRAPIVLLVWGPLRVVPVRVTSVSITEQLFDTLLNPIQAKVDLGLTALSEPELKQAGPPFDLLGIVQQVSKDVLARTNVFNSIEAIGGGLRL